MKFLFNLYLNNINQNITRFQYWAFIGGISILGLGLGLFQNVFEINIKPVVILISILCVWPSLIIIIKRLNDAGSNNIIINTIIAIALSILLVPEIYNLIVFAWIIIGVIPTGFINFNKDPI